MSETPRGRFVWHELMSTDPNGAQTFYQKVVGWATAPFGDDGSYTLWMNGQAPVGGVMGATVRSALVRTASAGAAIRSEAAASAANGKNRVMAGA